MHKRILSLMPVVVAAIAFGFSIDAHAAIAVSAALTHVDLVGSLTHYGAGLGALGLAGMAIGSTADATQLAKSKMFRIAVEGATTDGRVIERSWLEQIAATYSATKYGARVNLEHYRGIVPDGPFKAYGDVLAVEVRELEGEFAGKLGLYAQIAPTPELVAMTKAAQKIYTSCEIDTNFANTKQAYLVGLAVTDSPASLGTEILSFAAQNPAASPFAHRKQSATNLFTVAEETSIELEPATEAPASLGAIMSGVKELLNKLGIAKPAASTGATPAAGADAAHFAQMAEAVEKLAKHAIEQAQASIDAEKRIAELTAQVSALSDARDADRQAFDELHTQLSNTGTATPRPASTGTPAAVVTDC